MLFSYVTQVRHPTGVSWQIATSTSTDLVSWTAPSPWPVQPGMRDAASPDIVREPSGRFVVTFQATPTNVPNSQAKIYYRTSPDLVHWSAARRLAADLAPRPGDRQIDAALAWTPAGLLLGFKAGTTSSRQEFELASSSTGTLDGPWRLVGSPDITLYGGTVENYEFLQIGGRWTLLATSNVFDQPWIFTLRGDPRTAEGWLSWDPGRQLIVPGQRWDTGTGISSVDFEHANSAFLCDARSVDGHFYLLYAGSRELTRFGGWGHAKIGIARSSDLLTWEVPPPA